MLTKLGKCIKYKFVFFTFFEGRIAQLGERRSYKPEATGSIPVAPTIIIEIELRIDKRGRSSVWLERRLVTPEVASSSLVGPAIYFICLSSNLSILQRQ